MAKKSEADLRTDINKAIEIFQPITFVTFYLSDYGEMVVKLISESILRHFNRFDMMEIVYTAAKELIINATKANIKRVLFHDRNLNPDNPKQYAEGLKLFKDELNEDNVRRYVPKFRAQNLPVHATFYYSPEVLNIKVKNAFPLLPQEEKRIRDKFYKARSFSSLIDFYTEYSDDTEGAGLGLTMVGILLDNTGIDRHAFTLYSNKIYNETAAKLEIPLTDTYVSKRRRFEIEREDRGLSADELRHQFQAKSIEPYTGPTTAG